MAKMFVYGTLKRGQSAHDLMEGSKFLGEMSTHPRYSLYNMGGFPGMGEGKEAGGVHGELFEVDEDCLWRVDRYEGAPHLFKRAVIELADGTKAEAYMFNRSLAGRPRIKSGVWNESQTVSG